MIDLNRNAIEWGQLNLPELFKNHDAIHRGIREVMATAASDQAHQCAYQLTVAHQSLSGLFLYVSLNTLKRRVFRTRLELTPEQSQQLERLAFYFHYQPLFDAFRAVAPTLEKPFNFHDPEFFIHEMLLISNDDLLHELQRQYPWFSKELLIMGCRELPQWQRQYDQMHDANPNPIAVYDNFNWHVFLTQIVPQLKPFAQHLNRQPAAEERDNDLDAARRVLQYHAKLMYQLYHDAPVFGQEAFSLSQIYVRTECKVLRWSHIQDMGKQAETKTRVAWEDLHKNRYVERHDAEDTILELLADAEYKDAIVVQGMAGSGKSSLSLRLCDRLLAEDFTPIRIRLRDINLDPGVALLDALNHALQLQDTNLPNEQTAIPKADHIFDVDSLWQETLAFRERTLCRYVLILDGWDEISVSSTEGFHHRADRFLNQVRRTFLGRNIPIGVIVTGRPSAVVAETGFLKQDTRILNLLSLKPAIVSDLADKLVQAQTKPRFEVADAFSWQLDIARFAPLLAAYGAAFETDNPDAMAVLGSPLLAFLTMRMLSDAQVSAQDLVRNPTLLYRELVNQTCAKSGQPAAHDYNPDLGWRISGEPLRCLLHATAIAMFINGKDNLSYAELDFRLSQLVDDWDEQTLPLDDQVKLSEKDHPLMQLMISYFFKGGNRQLGCEFMHKSFREYLFAEAVVTRLKEYARHVSAVQKSAYHEPFWEAGDGHDPRQSLAEDLARMLAANWLTPEIHGYLFALIHIEIQKVKESSVDKRNWEHIRDALADIWAWWVDEIPMQSQAVRHRKTRSWTYEEPFYADLSRWCLPYDRNQRKQMPLSQVSLDGHLGDALWQLNSAVHFGVAEVTGWRELEDRWQDMKAHPQQRFQVQVEAEGKGLWTLFAPAGLERNFSFGESQYNDLPMSLAARINAARFRPQGQFPSCAVLDGNAMPHVWWPGVWAVAAKMSEANFFYARLDNARLDNASLDNARLHHASLVNASLHDARLDYASLDHASLDYARLHHARLHHASLDYARLDHASLDNASLVNASLNGANLYNTNIKDAKLH